ncbi:hypothetical protein [Bacillus bombysepticus]|uniref:hypothetical protein n=1 Tax=Bacillus bombysepticus TaxID=658666 RepID=UPI003018C98F
MKLIVQNQQTKLLLEKLFIVLNELDAWDDIINADHSDFENDEELLVTEEYELLQGNIHIKCVEVDEQSKVTAIKHIVQNQLEQKLLERFYSVLHEADAWNDIIHADHSGFSDEERILTLEEYDLLKKQVHGTYIYVDADIPELKFNDDECIKGICVKCGVSTTGKTDGEEPTYAEWIEMKSNEVQSTWKCEKCYLSEPVE